MKNLVILGGGTGGTILSNLLGNRLNSNEWKIKVINNAVHHVYQPGLLFIPFALYGYEKASDVVKEHGFNVSRKAEYLHEDIKSVDTKKKVITTDKGTHPYDIAVFSLGCRLAPEEVPGLEEAAKPGQGRNAHYFYTLESALECQEALKKFSGGKLVINIADMPIKCPVAPIEFAFLADYYLTLRGIRSKTDIIFTTPLAGAFTKPMATKVFGEVAKAKGITIIGNYDLSGVDPVKRQLSSHSKGTVDYDLLISIPPNIGSDVIEEAGLGNGVGFLDVNNHTLKSTKADDVFAIGDNTTVPTSKAGSVTHFESEVMVENILRHIAGKDLEPAYDGHSNCFIESGFKKALLIDFNYKIEPLPGKFPLPVLGPFTLLKETRMNHVGKMRFKDLYWNHLLKGTMPGESLGIVTSNMQMRGKNPPADWKPAA